MVPNMEVLMALHTIIMDLVDQWEDVALVSYNINIDLKQMIIIFFYKDLFVILETPHLNHHRHHRATMT